MTTQQQIPLTTTSEIMRELRHGWVHAIHHNKGYWVTRARLMRSGDLFITLLPARAGSGEWPVEPTHEVQFSPALRVWTLI